MGRLFRQIDDADLVEIRLAVTPISIVADQCDVVPGHELGQLERAGTGGALVEIGDIARGDLCLKAAADELWELGERGLEGEPHRQRIDLLDAVDHRKRPNAQATRLPG